ncbi:MAG: hypothetical protein E7345_05375 [Clostridiales bacterium]|nr:hypothetical protein [Clostridiales bacterium]
MYREKEENYSIIKAIPGTLRAYDEVDNIDASQPTIIGLGGNMTDSVQRALGMCRIPKSWLGLMRPDKLSNFARDGDINTYSINYGVSDSEDYLSSTYISSEEISDLTNKIFYNLIFKCDNELFSLDEIKENFSNLHFVTHCYGGYVLSRIVEYLAELLTIIGADFDTIKDCMKSITAINYAPMEIPQFITNINILSLKDDLIDVTKYKDICDSPITLQVEDNNLNIISKQIVSNPKEKGYINDHNIKNLYRNAKWKCGFYDTTEGEFADFVYPGGNADCISEIISHILGENLASSLRRQPGKIAPKPTITDMQNIAYNILSYFSEEDLTR